MTRHPSDVIDQDSGKVRVLSYRCSTCLFRRDHPFGEDRAAEVIGTNVARGALLTCHTTLPYGSYLEFGPAVCAGFWSRHGLATAAGRIAERLIGIVRIAPPGGAGGRCPVGDCGNLVDDDEPCASCSELIDGGWIREVPA